MIDLQGCNVTKQQKTKVGGYGSKMSQEDQKPCDVDEENSDKPPKKARYSSEPCPGTSSASENATCNCTKRAVSPQMKLSMTGRSLDYDIPLESFTMQNSDELADVLFSADVLDGPNNEDQLLRWQARQMAKGFVDNTINRVLERWRLSGKERHHCFCWWWHLLVSSGTVCKTLLSRQCR